jgi:hypothetical protein
MFALPLKFKHFGGLGLLDGGTKSFKAKCAIEYRHSALSYRIDVNIL